MDGDSGSIAHSGEARICQVCEKRFNIEPEDFDFYKKIDVPAPTFCPDCRMQRRFCWRNEKSLFRNKCSATGKNLISGFHPDSGVIVYERDYWWSDKWDPMDFGMDYDFGKNFFAQFKELLLRVPMPSLFNSRTVNCEYSSYTGEFKDAYMVSASWEGENVAYASRANSTKDSMDVLSVVHCERCYEVVSSEKLYNCLFCQDSENCTDSWFLYGCKGCSNCFGSTNLRNKSYYIFNEPYSREDYLAKLQDLKINTAAGLFAAKKLFEEIKLKAIRKYATNINCQNVVGDRVSHASNCYYCFDVFDGVKDCKYLANALQITDSYDGYGVGAKAELMYEAIDSGVQGSRQCFVATTYGGSNIFYSLNCHGCNNLLGCIGLRGKEYCIFNKQYSKEEFEELRARIIKQMSEFPYVDSKGRKYGYGEYFPSEISPFAYNETVAQEYFQLDKSAAAEMGFPWRDKEKGVYDITLRASELPEIDQANEDILKAVISCEKCGYAYRIIPQELRFLRRANVPMPKLCFECRHRSRFLQINPPKVCHRKCMCSGLESENKVYPNTVQHAHGSSPCKNEFETSYAPDRPEIVYCEQCYNAEVV